MCQKIINNMGEKSENLVETIRDKKKKQLMSLSVVLNSCTVTFQLLVLVDEDVFGG